jgi:hypothetical protein
LTRQKWRVIAGRLSAYGRCQKSMQCIKIYEDFSYLYSCLVKELHIFDSNGNFRDRNVAEGNIEILLALLDTLGRTTLSDTVARIRKSLPELLNYFDQAAYSR